MLKPTKEDNYASLLVMENCLLDCLMDAMQYQSQAMYALWTIFLFIQINQLSKRLQTTTKSAVPILIRTYQLSKRLQMTAMKSATPLLILTHYLLPIQETPDGNEIATSSESNISLVLFKIRCLYHVSYFESTNLISTKSFMSPCFN
jgi:hypothetical protein